ncbi:hypothetical protein GJAV_G00090800 [Gymnothorax javanicus]|nr:hypothetical protein GJAV_G00090800 [Gymnothorax javanicus]
MILTQKVCSPPPPPGYFVDADLHRQQWRRVQHLANTFWERWRHEYLSTLQSRAKWQKNHPNIKEGDRVLLCDTQVKRNQWPMALVMKAFPASDGKPTPYLRLDHCFSSGSIFWIPLLSCDRLITLAASQS